MLVLTGDGQQRWQWMELVGDGWSWEWSVHILNKDSKEQRYFIESDIARSVFIIGPVTLAM